MKVNTFFTFSAAIAGAVAAPFTFPTSDGFPNVNATLLEQLFKAAGGTLGGGQFPTSLKAPAITTLQVLAANELSEVAFFTELLANVTNDVKGYGLPHPARDAVIKSLTAIVAVSQFSNPGRRSST